MNFLINSLTSWNEIPRARHQVTEELVRAGHRVVFIEKNKIGMFRFNTQLLHTGLTLVTPLFPCDYRFRFRLPLVNEFYQRWLFARLRERYGDTVVVNFDFTAHLLHRLNAKYIYYCNDEYIGNSRYRCRPIEAYHRSVERVVSGRAAFCIATSPHLTRKLSLSNPSVYEIPLGGPNRDVFIDQRSFGPRQTIRVGLMGTIGNNVSTTIVNTLLQQDDIELVIIGRPEPGFWKQLQRKDKVFCKGILTGKALYEEMASFDVAIAPYDIGQINPGGTPNKLYQYLACSCPVVITELPNLQGLEFPAGTVYIAATAEEFVKAVRRAINEDCPAFAKARLALAAENTWETRIEYFLSLIANHDLAD
jgi:hypothetical protein